MNNWKEMRSIRHEYVPFKSCCFAVTVLLWCRLSKKNLITMSSFGSELENIIYKMYYKSNLYFMNMNICGAILLMGIPKSWHILTYYWKHTLNYYEISKKMAHGNFSWNIIWVRERFCLQTQITCLEWCILYFLQKLRC